jgi:hypothetical protein
MPSISVDRNFDGKTARDCFQAAVQILPQAGFEVIKLRELAYLIIGRRNDPRGEVICNVMAWPGVNARVTLTLESAILTVAELQANAERVFEKMSQVL